MNQLKTACLSAALAASLTTQAGGLLTNTNQNIAFNRMMSREASIAIDGVYYNPAGVAFLPNGHHLSLNVQTAWQTRTIDNSYALFRNNTNNPSTNRTFKGKAFAPVIPSAQYAYNKNGWSFQANFALAGGGGKCKFDDGLGSFEKIVAETAMGAIGLAGQVDGTLGAALGNPALKMFTSDQAFGQTGAYSFNSYMRGRQYYYGLSVGLARKFNDHFSAFAGVRAVYALANYYGYVKDIKVGAMDLYKVLDPSKTESANIELNCDQSGLGFTPIIGVDFKTGKWNFSAKYEFKTRMRLKNEAVNQAPSIGNLGDNLSKTMVSTLTQQLMQQPGMTQEAAQQQALAVTQQVLASQNVTGAMQQLKQQFDTKLDGAIGEYEDGKHIAADIPSLLTIGVGYRPIDALRINAGFHWFDDKHATAYNNRQEKLDHGTIEWNAGAEYDINKAVTVSAGWQNTNYGLTDEYMDDKSFVVSSNSVAVGTCIKLSKKMNLNVAYFHTFYTNKHTAEKVSDQLIYTADYTRDNDVFGVGLDINF